MKCFLALKINILRINSRAVDALRIYGCKILEDREMGLLEKICRHHGEEVVTSLTA